MNKEIQEFIGKKVTIDLEKLSEKDVEFDWSFEYSSNDDPTLEGSGHINLDYRPYNSVNDDEQDDDQEDNQDDDEEDEEFDESDNWNIQTGIDFQTDKNGCITSIEITAEVSCFGDSGLGDCDPNDEWTLKDYELAKVFLNQITQE